MGLLDNFDAEKLMTNPLLNVGLGIMANSYGPRGQNPLGAALGRGTMIGMQTTQEARQSQLVEQMRKMQMDQMQEAAKQKQAQQLAMQSAPEEVRQAVAMGVPYSEIWKNQNQAYNLGQGEKRFVGNKVVAEGAPKTPEWATLGPDGQMQVNPLYLDMKKQIAAAGRQTTNVNLPPMENEEQKALGKDLAEQYSGIQKAGMVGVGNMNNLSRMKSLLTGIETGKLTPAQTEVSGVLDSLGIKIDPKLPQKQAAAALSNELALRAKNQGGENLMPGAMSDPDRRFLQEMVPSLANTPGGNEIILETLHRKAQRDVEVAKMAREYRTKNKTLNGFSEELAAWSEKNPLFADLQKNAPKSGGFKIIGVR